MPEWGLGMRVHPLSSEALVSGGYGRCKRWHDAWRGTCGQEQAGIKRLHATTRKRVAQSEGHAACWVPTLLAYCSTSFDGE